jgi:hypothetical protein
LGGRKIARDVIILAKPEARPGREIFYEVSDLLYSFAVFAVIGRCFRCYFTAASFEKPEFLPPSEILPLYFPGFISGISGRGHRRSKSARNDLRSEAAAKTRCIRGCACFETRPGCAGSLLSMTYVVDGLEKTSSSMSPYASLVCIGARVMPEIVADPPCRCKSAASQTGIQESQRLDPDPYLTHARGRFAKGSSAVLRACIFSVKTGSEVVRSGLKRVGG